MSKTKKLVVRFKCDTASPSGTGVQDLKMNMGSETNELFLGFLSLELVSVQFGNLNRTELFVWMAG